MTDEIKIYFDLLYSKYNTLNLNKKQLSKELNVSIKTIDYYIQKSLLEINYLKMNNGRVLFPILEVRKYLQNTIKTH